MAMMQNNGVWMVIEASLIAVMLMSLNSGSETHIVLKLKSPLVKKHYKYSPERTEFPGCASVNITNNIVVIKLSDINRDRVKKNHVVNTYFLT